MGIKQQRSVLYFILDQLTVFMKSLATWLVILLFYATLPVTRFMCSRAPKPPSLVAKEVRSDKVISPQILPNHVLLVLAQREGPMKAGSSMRLLLPMRR